MDPIMTSVSARGVACLSNTSSPRRITNAALLASTALAFAAMSPVAAQAQDATWLANPGSGNFFDANNWNPNSVPTGTATFGASSTTTLTLGTSGTFDGWTFAAGAPDYTLNVSAGATQDFTGAGITIDGGSATIVNAGALRFSNASTAGSAAIGNNFMMDFYGSSSAGSAHIANVGFLTFHGNSTVDNAYIFNNFDLQFRDASSAGNATIEGSGSMQFRGSSTAGGATITNNYTVDFLDNSSAGNATFINRDTIAFNGTSTADSATINGGIVYFYGNSTAGSAAITVDAHLELGIFQNSTADSATITNNGTFDFRDAGSAGSATITNNSNLLFFHTSTASGATIINNGIQDFYGTSTAGSATITNTGTLGFFDTSTAGSASINNLGTLLFWDGSTAGSATITNSSLLNFRDNSTAGSAAITNSGTLDFHGGSTAGSAIVTNNGNLRFYDTSTAGNAALINNGTVDFSGSTGPNGDGKLSAGSIAGAGNYVLDANELTVGSNNLSTEVSGTISGTGSLVKTGTGTLALTGANTYTGGTTVNAGTVQLGTTSATGTIQGAVTVGNAGTFDIVNADTGGITAITNDGTTSFRNTSTAGNASITNAGDIAFKNTSSAGNAAITNTGALDFVNASTAGSASITNQNILNFSAASTAGNSLIVNALSLNFNDIGTAGSATITNNSNLNFHASSTASAARIDNYGSQYFNDTSTAGAASIENYGHQYFYDTSTAGSASINNHNEMAFRDSSTAGSAIINNAHHLYFYDDSTVGNATVTNDSQLRFYHLSTAGNAAIVNNATLEFYDTSTAGNATITNNGVLRFDDISTAGSASLINNAGGSVVFSSTGPNGDGKVSAGSIAGAGNYLLSGSELTVGSNNLSTTVSGVISGTGSLVKTGTGTLTLNGANTYTGDTTISSGKLVVNGALNGAINISGGSLGGSGTLGTLNINSGSNIAPGNSIGTLNVANITMAAGSTYTVELNDGGFVAGTNNDHINATGTATINGGTVHVTPVNVGETGSTYALGTYTILTAAGGITGAFNNVTDDYAFINFGLSYDANNAFLTSTLTDLCLAGFSANQCATADSLETVGSGALFTALTGLSNAAAPGAMNLLSGEIHASAKTALMEDSRFVRNAVNDRIHAAFDAGGASGAVSTDDGQQVVTPNTDHFAVWSQAFGSWGEAKGDGNAAHLNSTTGGLIVGADAPVFDTWRFGVLAGYSQTSFDVKNRQSSGSSDNYHVGLYGGTAWGDVAFRTGAAYTWHDVSTSRSVTFPGFSDSLKGSYGAATAQMFGELAYGFSAGSARFEPFANLAYVNLHAGGFTEQGGAAALTAAAANTNTTFVTLGLRASTTFDIGGTPLTAKGMVGWRHAFGDRAPTSTMRFGDAGDAFAIGGVPIAADAAVIEASIDYAITPSATLGLSYAGQLGSGMSDQSARFNLNVKF